MAKTNRVFAGWKAGGKQRKTRMPGTLAINPPRPKTPSTFLSRKGQS